MDVLYRLIAETLATFTYPCTTIRAWDKPMPCVETLLRSSQVQTSLTREPPRIPRLLDMRERVLQTHPCSLPTYGTHNLTFNRPWCGREVVGTRNQVIGDSPSPWLMGPGALDGCPYQALGDVPNTMSRNKVDTLFHIRVSRLGLLASEARPSTQRGETRPSPTPRGEETLPLGIGLVAED